MIGSNFEIRSKKMMKSSIFRLFCFNENCVADMQAFGNLGGNSSEGLVDVSLFFLIIPALLFDQEYLLL